MKPAYLFGLFFLSFPLAIGCGSSAGTSNAGSGGAGGGGGAPANGGGGSSGTTHAGGGSANGGGGAGGGVTLGKPFTTPDETWTFVGFDDSFCANGSHTGVGVNLTTRSKNVMIYFEGGGACWDETTCYTLGTATYVSTGYGQTQFDAEKAALLDTTPTFDRSDDQNPFKDYSFVYVPYCTGDVHAGNKVANYGGHTTMHLGFENVGAFLPRILGTWGDAAKVIVTGSSAGGFGAGFNWFRIKNAYPTAKVYLLDDSGPPLPSPYADGQEPTWRKAWNLDATLPPGCDACKQHLDALLPYVANQFPNERGALISYYDDNVIPTFYGISTLEMPDALDALATKDIDPQPNARYFYATGPGHVLLLGGETIQTQKGVLLRDWIRTMIEDQPGWESLEP
jgi:pectinacetylesterase